MMNPDQENWSRAVKRLSLAVSQLGWPKELAGLLARQLGSLKAIDRMASYVILAHPDSLEMIIDEMLAICAEIDAWREKKEYLSAQAGYSAWLRSEERLKMEEEL